jgi:hypothetical protein
MGLDKIALQSGQIMVTEVPSSYSIIELYGSNFLYGTISKVSDVCDNYSAGDIIIYDTNGSTAMIIEGDPYSLITEDKIHLKELP